MPKPEPGERVTEKLWQHNWLFVIIPVKEADTGDVAYPTFPMMCAYCKHCDGYVTTPLEWSAYGTRQGKVGLPEWGCVGPKGV